MKWGPLLPMPPPTPPSPQPAGWAQAFLATPLNGWGAGPGRGTWQEPALPGWLDGKITPKKGGEGGGWALGGPRTAPTGPPNPWDQGAAKYPSAPTDFGALGPQPPPGSQTN